MTEVERLAEHVVLMDKGRVLAAGPLADLQSDPSLPLAIARDAAVTLDGVVEAHDARYGLLTLGVTGGRFVAPAPPAPIGEHRRIQIVARDVSLAREPPGPSSILNVLAGRIASVRAVESNEMLAVVALGTEGQGARLLSRLTRKSWDQLASPRGPQSMRRSRPSRWGRGAGHRGVCVSCALGAADAAPPSRTLTRERRGRQWRMRRRVRVPRTPWRRDAGPPRRIRAGMCRARYLISIWPKSRRRSPSQARGRTAA